MGLQADVRAAAMDTLGDYATAQSVKLQRYAGRPASINPPTAFVDAMRETTTYLGQVIQRTVQADIVLIHGVFDSADAAAQKDAFVDGYIDHVRNDLSADGTNAHLGSGSTLGVVSTEDDPTFVPEWLGPQNGGGRTYFATRITLEGFAGE